MEKITNAAIIWRGQVIALPRPARHHTIMKAIADTIPTDEWPVQGEQGFMTSGGRFVGREAAATIALAACQCSQLIAGPRLFSEDLW